MKHNSFNLENKNIIITGGNGFLGEQITDALIKERANIYIIDIKKKINQKKSVNYFIADITKEKELINILKFFKSKKIKIDVLINNAATNYHPFKLKNNNLKLEMFSNEIWDKDISVGLKGGYLCTKIFGTYMSKFKKGSIINVSSDLGIIAPDQRIYGKGFVKPITYSVVKHGIIGLTKYTASYWGNKNIRCNAIAPGGIYKNQPKKFIEKINRLIPLGRMAKKNEYNGLILFLCSDLSSYITGSVIVSDGGRTII